MLAGPPGTVVVCRARALHGPGPPWGAPALAGLAPAWEGSWVRCGWEVFPTSVPTRGGPGPGWTGGPAAGRVLPPAITHAGQEELFPLLLSMKK